MAVHFVHAATFDDAVDANDFRDYLLDEGIPAVLVAVTDEEGTDSGKVRLEVLQEYAADVHQLLAGRPGVVRAGNEHLAELQPPWQCPGCGAAVDGERFTCPHCRSLRPARPDPPSVHAHPSALTHGPLAPTDDSPIPPVPPLDETPFSVPSIGSVAKRGHRKERGILHASLLFGSMTALITVSALSGLPCCALPLLLLCAYTLRSALRFWGMDPDASAYIIVGDTLVMAIYFAAILLGLLVAVVLLLTLL